MNILSLHYGHNATVGLAQAGELACLLSEERIVRVKNVVGLPTTALRHVLDTYLGGDAGRVDAIVVSEELLFGVDYLAARNFQPTRYLDYYYKTEQNVIPDEFKKKPERLLKRDLESWEKAIQTRGREPQLRKAAEELGRRTGLPADKFHFLNHHRSHALSCLAGLDPEQRHLIFTCDGEGDGLCATVSVWEHGALRTLQRIPNSFSPGYLYSEATAFLGMKSNEHEFKLMGLAPYADAQQARRICDKIREWFWLDAEGVFQARFPLLRAKWFFLQHFVYERFDQLAAGVQLFTEELLTGWIRHWIRRTGVSSIGCAGGVFMNVKACQKIAELPEVEHIFVTPSGGDESLVIGGCLHGHQLLTGRPLRPMQGLYLGRASTDAEVDAAIAAVRSDASLVEERFDTIEAINRRVAELLAAGQIVARYNGREEWGARSLGNRSILAHPSSWETVQVLNSQIKSRDFWMPFAPSLLEEEVERYVLNPRKTYSPYMTMTFTCTDEGRRRFQAAMHPQDRTLRIQAVRQSWNPSYHHLLREFQQLTGIGGVLNTSFNLHGEPIVGSPEDAVRTLRQSGLRHLALGTRLLSKRDSGERQE